MSTSKCQWKMLPPEQFTMGVSAERCGAVAILKILRPYRKTDLYLCEQHTNQFIDTWGLHNHVELLCVNWLWDNIEWGEDPSRCTNPNCKKCLQDDPKTWRHE